MTLPSVHLKFCYCFSHFISNVLTTSRSTLQWPTVLQYIAPHSFRKYSVLLIGLCGYSIGQKCQTPHPWVRTSPESETVGPRTPGKIVIRGRIWVWHHYPWWNLFGSILICFYCCKFVRLWETLKIVSIYLLENDEFLSIIVWCIYIDDIQKVHIDCQIKLLCNKI